MSAWTDGTNDVSAIELAHRKEIQRSGEQANPRGTANGIEQHVRGMCVWLDNRAHEFQDQRNTENDVGIRIQRKRRNDASV